MPRHTGAAVIAIVVVSTLVAWWLTRSTINPLPARALSVTLPDGHDVIETAISPDGTTLVYAAIADGQARLFVRRLSTFAIDPLAGTEGATQPFVSPDGARVGYFASGFLRWVALDGSPPVDVIPVAGETAGATWGAGDQIVFAPLGGQGLRRVSAHPRADGSPPTVSELTILDEDATEVSHGWPHFLPDGRSLVFTVGRSDRDPRLVWMSLESQERQLLESVDGQAFYVNSGHLVYARRGEIFAMPVSIDEQSVTGPVRLVASGAAGSAVGYARLGRSSLVAARTGLLIFVPVSDASSANLLAWVDRKGSWESVDGVPARHQAPRVSPDGSQIAMAISAGTFTRDLWTLSLTTGERRRVTQEAGDNHSPLWADNGQHITFASNRDGPQRIYRVTPFERAGIETLLFGDGRTPGSWSPDGQNLFFHELQPGQERDIWVWTPGSGESTLLLGSTANERSPAISPDGRWMAYVSDARDGDQVYLRPHPEAADVRVSPTGGTEPVWSPDGSELFYRRGRDLVAVEVADSGQVSTPQRLFAGSFVIDPGGNVAAYDVSPDGSRFLMLRPVARTGTLSVIDRWQHAVFRNDRGTAEP